MMGTVALNWLYVLKKSENSLENTLSQGLSFIKKETLTLVPSYQFCKSLRTPFFREYLREIVSLTT